MQCVINMYVMSVIEYLFYLWHSARAVDKFGDF